MKRILYTEMYYLTFFETLFYIFECILLIFISEGPTLENREILSSDEKSESASGLTTSETRAKLRIDGTALERFFIGWALKTDNLNVRNLS